ncbi:MAG: M50 family metallopeptidase [Clostridia bacterium]|nr:M50 family metallopeptidase [Clostridia bacterium]
MRERARCDVSPGFFFLLGALFLWAGAEQTLILLLAALLHEAGHLAVGRLLGARLRRLRLGFFGWEADLERERLSYRREAMLDLAGPLFSLLGAAGAFLLIRLSPSRSRFFFFFCNGVFALLQLLPAPELDGGRALTALLSLSRERERAERAVRRCGRVVKAALAAGGAWALFSLGNPSPLLFFLGALLPRGGGSFQAAKREKPRRGASPSESRNA